MEVRVKELIDFKRKEKEGPKKTIIKNLKNPKESTGEERNYWTRSISAIQNAYWARTKTPIHEKIDILKDLVEATERTGTKLQYQRNLDNCISMLDYDFNSIFPTGDTTNLKPLSAKAIINLDGIDVKTAPQKVFSYEKNGQKYAGGVWFVAIKDGYKHSELGMFATSIYISLTRRFSPKHIIDPELCVAVDVTSGRDVRYSQIKNKEYAEVLTKTIEEMKNLM